MKKTPTGGDPNASQRITNQIADLGDWRGKVLARLRKVILDAAPDITEDSRGIKLLQTAPAGELYRYCDTWASILSFLAFSPWMAFISVYIGGCRTSSCPSRRRTL
jgi:hypothetical protein